MGSWSSQRTQILIAICYQFYLVQTFHARQAKRHFCLVGTQVKIGRFRSFRPTVEKYFNYLVFFPFPLSFFALSLYRSPSEHIVHVL